MTLAPVKRADVRPGERRRWCATWIEACSLIAERAVTADDLHLGPCEFPEWDGDGDDPRYAIVDRPQPSPHDEVNPRAEKMWRQAYLAAMKGYMADRRLWQHDDCARHADWALAEWRKRWSK